MWHDQPLIYCRTCSDALRLQDCGETNERTDGRDHSAFERSIRFHQRLIPERHNDGTGASGNMSLASA